MADAALALVAVLGFRKRIATSIGLGAVRLHDLRHGVGTMLGRSGTPAYVTSKMLGHASVGFTLDVYQHADEESMDRAGAAISDAFDAAEEST